MLELPDDEAVGAAKSSIADDHGAAVYEIRRGLREVGREEEADARLTAREAREIDAIESRGEDEVTGDTGVDESEYLRAALELAAPRDVDGVAVLVRRCRAAGEDRRIHREIVDVDAVPHGWRWRQRDVVTAAGHRAVG